MLEPCGHLGRLGGHLVAESLRALGATAVFGLPGVHALGIWEGLRVTPGLRTLAFRNELNAAWAADGYARATGRPAPLVVSSGPGALMSLAGVMEAAHSSDPLIVIATAVRRDEGFGHGHLHELRDQEGSFAPLVKRSAKVSSVESIPFVLRDAYRAALDPPTGPAYVEIPVDLVHAPTSSQVIEDLAFDILPKVEAPPQFVAEAAQRLNSAVRPLICAGGGAVRAGAADQIRELALRLDAPVASTYSGKGVFDETDELSLGSSWEEHAFLDEVDASDIVLCVGTSLGRETTDWSRRTPEGGLIHIDVDPERVGRIQPSLSLVGDAGATLDLLLGQVSARPQSQNGTGRVDAMRTRIASGLDAQPRKRELSMLKAVEHALPAEAAIACDSTILGYLGASYLRIRETQRFLYPLGSGTIGYAWPASLGAAAGLDGSSTLAIAGDGGFLYGLSELASARQERLPAKLLVIDDQGYGILRQYQNEAGLGRFGVDLESPDFVAACAAFSVPTRRAEWDELADALEWAFASEGPAVVVVETEISMTEPTP